MHEHETLVGFINNNGAYIICYLIILYNKQILDNFSLCDPIVYYNNIIIPMKIIIIIIIIVIIIIIIIIITILIFVIITLSVLNYIMVR